MLQQAILYIFHFSQRYREGRKALEDSLGAKSIWQQATSTKKTKATEFEMTCVHTMYYDVLCKCMFHPASGHKWTLDKTTSTNSTNPNLQKRMVKWPWQEGHLELFHNPENPQHCPGWCKSAVSLGGKCGNWGLIVTPPASEAQGLVESQAS